MSSGNPRRFASAAGSEPPPDTARDPGTTGTPAFSIASRERSLPPIASIAAAGAPTQVRPAASTALANAAFSERKPYPG